MHTKVGCAIVAGYNLPNFAKRKGQLLVTLYFKSIDDIDFIFLKPNSYYTLETYITQECA